jgi:hypothetical protein
MTVMFRCCVLGAVLLPVGVAAEITSMQYQGKHCRAQGFGEWVCSTNDEQQQLVISDKREKACFAKMREAMRAIAPFTHPTEYIVSEHAVYESPAARMREEADQIERKDKAVQQFNETYRECVEGKP